MTHSTDWENCDVAAAVKELREILPLMQELGRQESPSADLYFSKELMNAIRLVNTMPTVANAKTLCALLPTFESVCFRRTPQGTVFQMGEVLGQELFQHTIGLAEAFFDLYSHMINRPKNIFLYDHLLVLAYLTANLIGNPDLVQKEFLIDGMRSQLASAAMAKSLLKKEESSPTEAFELSCLRFTQHANSVSGKLDETALRAIIATMSSGNFRLSNAYRELLLTNSGSIRQLIHRFITLQADKLK